jgi:hypothetical protein
MSSRTSPQDAREGPSSESGPPGQAYERPPRSTPHHDRRGSRWRGEPQAKREEQDEAAKGDGGATPANLRIPLIVIIESGDRDRAFRRIVIRRSERSDVGG